MMSLIHRLRLFWFAGRVSRQLQKLGMAMPQADALVNEHMQHIDGCRLAGVEATEVALVVVLALITPSTTTYSGVMNSCAILSSRR